MLTTLISFVLAVAPAHADDGAGTPPVPLRRWEPSYPDLGILPDIALLRCEVEALVDEQGRVADVQALDCFPNLFPDTDRALRKWTFQPAVRDDVPVPGRYVVAFEALDGVAQDIQVQECFSGLEQSTRKVVKRWVWNSYGGQARPYDLTVWYHPEPGGR